MISNPEENAALSPFHAVLAKNRRWAEERHAVDPEFFARTAREHKPRFLWIGCSDARVPSDVVAQTDPGDLFVHRNIANQVVATDPNLLAVLQYGIEVLRIEDVIVCGHEQCGGVKAAIDGGAPATVANWLTHVRTVARLHDVELAGLESAEARIVRLVELNVAEQVFNLSRIPVVQDAWARGQTLRLHGVVYGMNEGLLRDVAVMFDGPATQPRAPSSVLPTPIRPPQFGRRSNDAALRAG